MAINRIFITLIVLSSLISTSFCTQLYAQTTNKTSNALTDPDYTGEKGQRLSPVIAFKAGKSLIDMNGMASVEQVANYLKNHSSTKIVIEGYASANLDAETSKKLSADRAASVKKTLTETYGIPASRIVANGKGSADEGVIQLRKSGDAVLVYEQKTHEEPRPAKKTSSYQEQARRTGTSSKNGNGGKADGSGNILYDILAYAMINTMTSDYQTCIYCGGTGCSYCNNVGEYIVTNQGLTNSIFGLYKDISGGSMQSQTTHNSIKDGYQKVETENGFTIEGNFKNGVLNGQGKAYDADGTMYVGNFKNSTIDGKGTMTFSWGGKYVGDFKDNEIEGKGTFTRDDIKYVGDFKNGKFNGHGTIYIKEEKTFIKGIWKDNELIEEIERGQWNPNASKTPTKKTTRKK